MLWCFILWIGIAEKNTEKSILVKNKLFPCGKSEMASDVHEKTHESVVNTHCSTSMAFTMLVQSHRWVVSGVLNLLLVWHIQWVMIAKGVRCDILRIKPCYDANRDHSTLNRFRVSWCIRVFHYRDFITEIPTKYIWSCRFKGHLGDHSNLTVESNWV